MERIKRIWQNTCNCGRRIRNVFTDEIEKTVKATDIKHSHEIIDLVYIIDDMAKEMQARIKITDSLYNQRDYRDRKITSLTKENLSLNKELSSLSIQYFKVIDSREKLVQSMKRALPGKVDII